MSLVQNTYLGSTVTPQLMQFAELHQEHAANPQLLVGCTYAGYKHSIMPLYETDYFLLSVRVCTNGQALVGLH